MRAAIGVGIVVVLAVVGFFAWVYSGAFNVAANVPHSGLTEWLFETVKRQSVRARARDIAVPPLNDPLLVEEGARMFEENCKGCHGAPGAAARPMARHMLPKPADLTREGAGWTSAELFWIVRNGIKMTGMPASEDARLDDEIWALVAFIGQLPGMEAARYQAMVAPPPPPEPAPEAGQQPEETVPPPEGEQPVRPSPVQPPQDGAEPAVPAPQPR